MINARPQKTYPAMLIDLAKLADTLAELDAYVPTHIKHRITDAYSLIERIAGVDAVLIFAPEQEAA